MSSEALIVCGAFSYFACRLDSVFLLCLNTWMLSKKKTIYFILLTSYFQAMIIVAWNGSGQPSSIFNVDVFMKVLSVFITAAILKLCQGWESF